jgi:hypothetical protein
VNAAGGATTGMMFTSAARAVAASNDSQCTTSARWTPIDAHTGSDADDIVPASCGCWLAVLITYHTRSDAAQRARAEIASSYRGVL